MSHSHRQPFRIFTEGVIITKPATLGRLFIGRRVGRLEVKEGNRGFRHCGHWYRYPTPSFHTRGHSVLLMWSVGKGWTMGKGWRMCNRKKEDLICPQFLQGHPLLSPIQPLLLHFLLLSPLNPALLQYFCLPPPQFVLLFQVPGF